MKDPLQMLAENQSIDAQFRQILPVRTPTPSEVRDAHGNFLGIRTPFAMTAHSESSKTMLTEAAEILCSTDAERKLLQSVYDVAVLDGRLERAKEMLDHIQRELKA